MFIELNIDKSISNKVIENEIKRFSREYILRLPIDTRLRAIEDYLFDSYKFNIDIKEIMNLIVNNFSISRVGNRIYLILPKTVKLQDVNLDLIEKIISYGNRTVRGCNSIREAINYALMNM